MRTFEHFPVIALCRICKTNDDKEAILVPVYGTQEDNNIQATPVHTECLQEQMLFYKELDLIIINCK